MADHFQFGDRRIEFQAGQTLAAALTEAGERRFRETAKGGERGIFCGMGVCQDCLLTVNGIPNVRACMTRAENGMTVARQVAYPALDAAVEPEAQKTGQVLTPDVAILGGGAGGLSAAIEAAAAGADVLVLDERKTGGGQYYKQAAGHPPLDRQQSDGAALIAAAEAAGARILSGVEVWGAFDGPLLMAFGDGRAIAIRPKALIIATGAYERPVMVPGWTLPGVMTTGAAQTLWRSYRTLPGKRVLICGSGPLNAQVASELSAGGTKVLRVLETAASPLKRALAAGQMAFAAPNLALDGIATLLRLRRAGVAVNYGTRLIHIAETSDGLCATWRDRDGRELHEDVDAVIMNAGFQPQNEVLRLLGARMTYDTAFGQLRCVRDRDMRTSVDAVFAVGDCAGLGGAPAAKVEGRIAGRAAARSIGRDIGERDDISDHRELARHRRFQKLLWQLFDPIPQHTETMTPDTILCRCEEVTLAEAEAALAAETGHLGTLKRASRIGMGRCQGRYCGPLAAQIIAERTGRPLEDLSFFAPRVPIKPVAISAILAAEELLDAKD